MTDIHDHVEELTRPHTHRERYEYRENGALWNRDHVTSVPSLLDQLGDTSNTQDGSNGTGGYKSRPAAWLEPLDTLALIDQEAARWVRDLGEDDPLDTAACVLKVHGLWASADDATKKAIEKSVRSWWSQARVITGWDSPAWRPDNTCPVVECDGRRSLRIKVLDQMGFCVECRATWEPETIGLLADHIRAENGEEESFGESA